MVSELKAYCVTCRAKRGIVHPVVRKLKNNHKIAKGTCQVCHGKVALFVPVTTPLGAWKGAPRMRMHMKMTRSRAARR